MLTVTEQPSNTTPNDIEPLQKGINVYVKWTILSFLMLAMGWMIADMLYQEPEQIIPQKGACHLTYQGVEYDIFSVPIFQNGLQLFCTDEQNVPFRDVQTLRGYLQAQKKELVFAMNAGMYTPENLPKGLYIEHQREIVPLDTAETGFGNFYLMPNGVFAFDDSSAVILDTKTFHKQPKQFAFATQSGPLLVINGVINRVFTQNANSLFIRNGVGITTDHKIVFAISNKPVNFYTFASLFKDRLQCPNALFLDGAISKMFAPEINRLDTEGDLGPFVALVKF